MNSRISSQRYVDELVLPEIHRMVEERGLSDYRVLVATHVEEYVSHCRLHLGDRCITREIARNADPGTRFNTIDLALYEKARDVLFDCLLLARCDFLFGTPSNVLLSALIFNPESPLKVFDYAMERSEGWCDTVKKTWVSPKVQ